MHHTTPKSDQTEALDRACRRALAQHLHGDELKLLDLSAVHLPPHVGRHALRVLEYFVAREDALRTVLVDDELRFGLVCLLRLVVVDAVAHGAKAVHHLREKI